MNIVVLNVGGRKQMRSDIENRRSWGKSTRFKYLNIFLKQDHCRWNNNACFELEKKRFIDSPKKNCRIKWTENRKKNENNDNKTRDSTTLLRASIPHLGRGVFCCCCVSILNELFGDPQMIGFSPHIFCHFN